MFAIIGGTGVYDPGMLENVEQVTIDTPYGPTIITTGKYQNQQVAFMARHGAGHKTPPHLIPYRANIWGLKQLGVKQILATAAVGSIRPEMQPGSLVVVDDFMDFTKSRLLTFHEGQEGVIHIDMTDPYCRDLRGRLINAAASLDIPLHPQGVYVCTEGPRFETRAEIRAYAQLGGDVVGMTTVPEVILAKELEMCYSTVGIVTNYCSGVADHPLTVQEVMDTMSANVRKVKQLFFEVISSEQTDICCDCQSALHEKGAL